MRDAGGRRPRHNGQPEESLTRHHPISIPSRPQRGRECQWRQPGSPMSSLEMRTQLVLGGLGDHPLEKPRLASSISPRRSISPRASATRSASASRTSLQLPDAEHPRAAGGSDAPLDLPAGEGRGEELGELALEAGDLAAQLDRVPGARRRPGALPGSRPAEARLTVSIRASLQKLRHGSLPADDSSGHSKRPRLLATGPRSRIRSSAHRSTLAAAYTAPPRLRRSRLHPVPAPPRHSIISPPARAPPRRRSRARP